MTDEPTVSEEVVEVDEVEEEVEAPEVDGVEASEVEEPEEIEIDLGGNKVRVPKGALPDEVVEQIDKFAKGTWSDYTRRSQEVAEQRKAIEARAEVVERLSSLTDEQLTLYSRGQNIRGELEQLQALDVNQMWQSDPDRARRVSDRIAALTSEFSKTVGELSAKEREAAQAREHEVQRVREHGRAAIEKRIPGFSQKVTEVVDYVHQTYGIDRAALERDWPMNPATAELAYKAMMYDRMKSARPKQAAKPVAPVAPVKAGKAPADVSRMSVEQMAQYLRR